MTGKLRNGVLAMALLSACALAQQTKPTTGKIHGTVFIVDDDRGRSVIPSVTISLTGATYSEGQSDGEGNFSFDSVIPGNYTISAEVPGMAATRNIVVEARAVSEVSLQMKLVVLAQSTTVTPNADQAETKKSSGTNTVGKSAVRNMPNIDEHFQSLLPLVPGVVRGPNGLINMKGARTSENGSLVNSADVTGRKAPELLIRC